FPSRSNYLFPGDYVNKGTQSMGTLPLTGLQNQISHDCFVLRGNHECDSIIWKTFADYFNCLWIAVILDEKIFCFGDPDQDCLCDFLWSDPDEGVFGWGLKMTEGRALYLHDLDLICKAHRRDSWSLSASSYCGELGKAGALMSVDETLVCCLQLLQPAEKKQCRET
ncbi:hypothetical protein FD755_016752, partial [Muntiacus reevesi]